MIASHKSAAVKCDRFLKKICVSFKISFHNQFSGWADGTQSPARQQAVNVMRYLIRQYYLTLLLTVGASALFGQTHEDNLFKKTKGTWISPVDKIISVDTQCFRQTCSHPYNYFLTIKSDSGASAKFVQFGQVTLVTQIGDLFAIIVKQGDYFLTYCGVTTTQVKKGDIVHQGQLIGPLGELQESVYGLEIGLSNGNKPQKRVHLWFNKSFQSFL